MKEQVSVEGELYCTQCNIIDQHIKKHLEYNPCKNTVNFIDTSEIERLKRIAGNAKKLIIELQSKHDEIKGFTMRSVHVIKLLESLDK